MDTPEEIITVRLALSLSNSMLLSTPSMVWLVLEFSSMVEMSISVPLIISSVVLRTPGPKGFFCNWICIFGNPDVAMHIALKNVACPSPENKIAIFHDKVWSRWSTLVNYLQIALLQHWCGKFFLFPRMSTFFLSKLSIYSFSFVVLKGPV